ncbi:MAG: sigma-70 family RNA polymerase sigma factor [Alphaproteobacteria bacterium]|nr:sigma-70 family RNA polymerase sigma factor [Alphaproteobacteria bacterium]
MRQGLAGDRRAYAAALEQTARLLRPYLAKRLSRPGEVEDVLQEILLSIHKARHTYDGKRPYAPWAFAIARFRLRDHLRGLYADRLRRASDLSAAENISAAPVTESGFSYESIKEEIRRLPGKQPTILHLMHGEGYTAREVAEKIGMKESAVKVAAHRAYKMLRKKLVE